VWSERTSGKIPGDQPKKGTGSCEGKDFGEKGFKVRLENATGNVNKWCRIRA